MLNPLQGSYFTKAFRTLAPLGVCLALIAFISIGSQVGAQGPSGNAESVPGEVIFKLKPGVSEADVKKLELDADADKNDLLSQVDSFKIRRIRSRSKSSVALINQLRANPNVVYAEPNYILRLAAVPNDERFGELYGLLNTGQTLLCATGCFGNATGTAGADIKAAQAWNFTTGDNSIVIGVIDTGVDYNHPDLAANIWSNPGGVGGCPQGTHGFNAITGACDPLDDHFHGTHCSGTIGAVGNNGIGVAGVNWTTSIMGLKFLNAFGSGTLANAISAIEFAVQAKIAGVNVRALSNSWGGGGFSQALLDEINKANANGILFIAAAGNSAANNDTAEFYPANYNAPNVVSVAATDNRDQLATFSNFGAAKVHLGAPGVDVLSTRPNNTYGYLSGTSMATPHVSGAAALFLAADPSLTTAQLKSRLLSSVDMVPSLTGKTITGGRLNVCYGVPGCAQPGFALAVSPSSQVVTSSAGGTVAYTINVTRILGFAGAVNLSVSGLPAGATATFSPNPASGTAATMSVKVNAGTPLGAYPLTITGISGALTNTINTTLLVTPYDFQLSLSPTQRSVRRDGGTVTYTVNITRTGIGAPPITLSVANLGTNAGFVAITPNPASTSATISFVVFATTPKGDYTFDVIGVDPTSGLKRVTIGKYKKG